MIRSSGLVRLITTLGALLLLAWCSYIAAYRGLAALYAYPGKSSLVQWRDGHRQMRQQDWAPVRKSLEQALVYDRHNPELLHDLGAAYDAEVAYYSPGSEVAGENRRTARQYYLEALSGRPVWPHDWIVLALVKYRLNQVDEEYQRAMRLALILGPWEPSVGLTVADLGLHQWETLDHDMRSIVSGIIRAAVKNVDTAAVMLTLVRRYDMLEMVCNEADATEPVISYCKRYYHP